MSFIESESPFISIWHQIDPSGEIRERFTAYEQQKNILLQQLKDSGEVVHTAINLPDDVMKELMEKHGLIGIFENISEEEQEEKQDTI